MKTVAAVKIGNMKDPDTDKRGRVQVVDMPEQELGDEDVRIQVAYCAICGSDPHLVEGIFGWKPPFGLGHEMSGVVIELGKRAGKNGIKVGDRVAGNFLRFCGSCDDCRNGDQQFCRFADQYNRPCMAERVVWHESQVFHLPDSVSLRTGCLLEPVSIAVRLMDKIDMKVGKTVAICGGGPIGLLATQVISRFGAVDLTVIEPIPQRRELAKAYGASHVIDPAGEDLAEMAQTITGGRGFDVVIDSSGAVGAAPSLLSLAARGGQVIYAAMYPADYQLPLNLFEYCYRRELSITGMYVAPYAFPRALRLLPQMDLDAFTAQVFPLEEAEAAFSAHLTGRYPKILLRCSDIDRMERQK